MADNVTANPGAGGVTFAADDIGGIYYPRTKLVTGADGSNDGDVSSANPLPVAVAGPVTVVGTGTLAVQAAISGPVTVVGTGTLAVQAAISGPVTVVGTGTLAVQPSQHTVVGNGTFAVQASISGPVTVVGTGTFAVSSVAQHTVLGNGTFAVQATTVAAHTVIGNGTFAVQPGQYLTVLGTLTTGGYTPLMTDINGRLLVAPGTADANIGGVDMVRVGVFTSAGVQVDSFAGGGAGGGTVTGTGTFAVQATSVAQHTVVGNGTFAVQASIAGPVTVVGTGTLAVQPAQHTVIGNGTFAVQATIAGPVTVVGTGTFAVSSVAQHTVLGTGTFAVQPTPHTTVGLSIFRSIDLDEGAAEQVKGSAGALYGGFVTNTSTGTRFVKFYNATSATVGTTTPVMTFAIPGNATDDIGATFNSGGIGIPFSTGICVGASTGVADADTGAPGANDVIINLWYA